VAYQLRQMTSLPRRKLASWSVDAIAKWPTDQLVAVAYGRRAGGQHRDQHHPRLGGWLPTMWGATPSFARPAGGRLNAVHGWIVKVRRMNKPGTRRGRSP
jgi:hypothetical protein